MVGAAQLLSFDIDRLLPASEWTVTHDAFPHHMSGHIDRTFSRGERRKVWRRDLGCIGDLEVKGSEWSQCQDRKRKGERRCATVQNAYRSACDNPGY